jgi:hypothetical protein
MEKEEVIKLWKKLGVTSGEFEFYCGGDSMGDTYFTYNTENGKLDDQSSDELTSYFEDEVYRNINFYEASDGHYMGECGTVFIELEDDEFSYTKSAQAEWSETLSDVILIPLTDEQAEFVKKNISNINGGSDENPQVNYSRDFIMTDKDEEIEKSITELVNDKTQSFEPDWTGEPQDWYVYRTEDVDVINEENQLVINIDNYEYVYTDSEY